MSAINDVLLKDYVDKQFAELNQTVKMLNQQLVTVIQSLECEVKKCYNKDIQIAQLRGEVSTLEKVLDKYVSVSHDVSQPRNIKKLNTASEEFTAEMQRHDQQIRKEPPGLRFGFKTHDPNCTPIKSDVPKAFNFGASLSSQQPVLETQQNVAF